MYKFSLLLCILLLTSVSGVTAQQTLSLPSGTKLVVYSLTALEPLGGTKTLQADVRVPGGENLTETQLSAVADEFFLFYFGIYAEKQGFRSAAISFSKQTKAGPLTFSSGHTFTYNLQENGAWKPEHDSLLDGDPLPEATALDLPSGNRIFVEFAGTGYLPEARRTGWGSNYWSKLSVKENSQAVYAQSREYWNGVKGMIPGSVGVAGIYAFDRPRVSIFHFRPYLYFILVRDGNGNWPELPPDFDDATRNKSKLIQASFGPTGLETVWPDR